MIKRQTTRSVVSCTQECLSEPLCSSFNFHSSSASQGVCELYKDGDEMKLTHKPGWFCGHILGERQKKVKPPAECKTWRTKDGGCCVFPFRYQGRLRASCVFDGQLWCSLTENYDIDKIKGVCEDFKFTFTTLGAQGPTGPADTSGYQGTTLQHKVRMDSGIQIWQVPLNGSYVIEAWGASGAQGRPSTGASAVAGGKGAYMKGTFNLTHGTFLKILVGQSGQHWHDWLSVTWGVALIVAGGGGGGGAKPGDSYKGDPGQTTGEGSQAGGSNGTGGIILEKGSPSSSFEGGAGGGLIGDGESDVTATGGKSFRNGGEGGSSFNGGKGGFGGGGGGFKYPGAGGGYSGGGVLMNGNKVIAGGGGSFNRGVNQ
ncbi:odorant binding [Desmophyllum pertusum]|uniref:Odorant binding n=1 Tax=Desmophyllum pertusum TaxID=174260 RepID=A0A9X0DA36_9CNID|nr:odorant binding [Desmophyllum pertusum]